MTNKQLEQKLFALEAENRTQKGLLHIQQAVQEMVRPQDLERVMQVCLEETNHMVSDICSIALHLVVDDEHCLVETYRFGLRGSITMGERRKSSFLTQCWKKGEMDNMTDVQLGEDWNVRRVRENFGGLLIRSYLDVPFTLGVISVHSLKPNAFSQAHEDILVQIGKIFSAGIARMHELEQVEDRLRLEQVYRNVAHMALSSLNLDGVLDNLGIHIVQADIFKTLSISLVDYDHNQVEVVRSFVCEGEGVTVHKEHHGMGIRYGLDATDPIAIVARTGEFLMIEGYDKRFTTTRAPKHFANKAFYFIPVVAKDKTIAVLATSSPLEKKEEMLKNIDAIQPLLDQVILAIEHARLYEYAQNEIQTRIQAEEALKSSKQRYQAIVETAVDAIITIDEYGMIEATNPATDKQFGYAPNELIGQNIKVLMPEPYCLEHDGYLRNHQLTGQKKIIGIGREVVGLRKDKTTFPLHLAVTESHIGNQKKYTGILRDLTKEKQREQEFVKLQRLRAVSELSAGVSHNLNNMLVGIKGPAEFLKMKNNNPEVLEYADDILTAALRARDLVQRLHQSTRSTQPIALASVHIDTLITEALHQTRPRWKDEAEAKGIVIEIETCLGQVPPVKATQSEMSDIFVNLIFNAVDALPKGGKINIQTECVGDEVILTFADTGIGMDEEIRKRIFEPFFTTKTNVGTRLGLSTIYNSLHHWDSRIEVDSEVGEGTTFRIYFQAYPDVIKQEAVMPVRSGRPGKILIVEDDDVVRKTLSQMLSAYHKVTVFSDGEKALETYAPGYYDVAIIDLGIPKISGDQVAQRMRLRDSFLATIMISGWVLEANDPRLDLFDFQLQKPFASPQNLYDMIDHAIRLYDQRVMQNGADISI